MSSPNEAVTGFLDDAIAQMVFKPASTLRWAISMSCYHYPLRAHKRTGFGKIRALASAPISSGQMRTTETDAWRRHEWIHCTGVQSLHLRVSTLFKIVGCYIWTSSGALFGFTSPTCPSFYSGDLELRPLRFQRSRKVIQGPRQEASETWVSAMLVASGDLGEQHQYGLSVWLWE